MLDISRFLPSCVDLRNGNHLFSTIIRKQAGGLADDLNDVRFGGQYTAVGGGGGEEDDQSCNILYILIHKGT